VRTWLILCVVLGGCGFRSAATSGGTADGAVDGPGSGSGSDAGPDSGSGNPPGCFAHWLDHSVAINLATVQEVTELSGTGNANERNPWISDDGMRMYFSRDQGAPNTGDIFFASRGSTTQMFGAPAALPNLNSGGREGRVWLTPTELTLAISTERDGPLDIEMITRGDMGQIFGSPNRDHLTMVNAVGTQRGDPFLTMDGLRLYLASDAGLAARFQLLIATRDSTSSDFKAPSVVPGFEADARNLADPTLYQDERLILFSTLLATGDDDLWYATRANATDPFGKPVLIPSVNMPGSEVDPVLTSDGCELYFSSNQRAGRRHIFRAQVTKVAGRGGYASSSGSATSSAGAGGTSRVTSST
jgi:hypothetical protein